MFPCPFNAGIALFRRRHRPVEAGAAREEEGEATWLYPIDEVDSAETEAEAEALGAAQADEADGE